VKNHKNVYKEIADLVRAEKEEAKDLGTKDKLESRLERIGKMFDKAGVKLDQHNAKEEAKSAKSPAQTPAAYKSGEELTRL